MLAHINYVGNTLGSATLPLFQGALEKAINPTITALENFFQENHSCCQLWGVSVLGAGLVYGLGRFLGLFKKGALGRGLTALNGATGGVLGGTAEIGGLGWLAYEVEQGLTGLGDTIDGPAAQQLHQHEGADAAPP